MSDEHWRPVPGFEGSHERSSLGRVRTTATGSSGLPATSFLWLLLLAAVALVLWKAHLVNSIANTIAVGVCAVPVLWLVGQAAGEARLSWECRRYAAQDARRTRPAPLAITARAPLAIEAARPVLPLVIEHDARKMSR